MKEQTRYIIIIMCFCQIFEVQVAVVKMVIL